MNDMQTDSAGQETGAGQETDRLDNLLANHPLPSWRLVAWPVMILLALLFGWAQYAQLDEVAVATGEVVPQGQVKLIQHLEGGIIKKIHVNDGDSVKAGDTLVQLDLSTSGINRKELQVRLDSQLLVRLRLNAEAESTELKFPEDIAKRRDNQVRAERRSFDARKRQLSSILSVQRQLVKQREQEVKELEARLRAVNRNLALAQERFKMSQSLLADGLTPKMEHLQLEAEVESLQGESRSLGPAIPRAHAAVSEARERMNEERDRFRSEAQDELVKTEQAIARIKELLAEATEQGVRAEIKSPIAGVVKNLRYHTIGGVVKPGDAIMEIVPTGENLVIEAKLNPNDRGYVERGQSAMVKISTYDFARYGGLDGKVLIIAPGTSTDEDGAPYFRVTVKTEKTYLGEEEGMLPITPGMEATVDIHTGTKSVMDYLIKPVLKLRYEAFRER